MADIKIVSSKTTVKKQHRTAGRCMCPQNMECLWR